MIDILRKIFVRTPNTWRVTWRFVMMTAALLLVHYAILDNLAIKEAFDKLKMSPEMVENLTLLVQTEPAIPIVLLLTVLVWLMGFARLAKLGAYLYAIELILTILASVITLLVTLAYRDDDVWGLMKDAVVVWLGNMVTFSIWYWLIDAPHAQIGERPQGKFEFLFPQRAGDLPGWQNWQPHFFDYLFLAFTTGTSFGPTETAPLSRRAKILVMSQSLISLIVIAVLAARGINILKPPT